MFAVTVSAGPVRDDPAAEGDPCPRRRGCRGGGDGDGDGDGDSDSDSDAGDVGDVVPPR